MSAPGFHRLLWPFSDQNFEPHPLPANSKPMINSVNTWHNIRTLVLLSLSKNGPTKENLKDFYRTFRATHGVRITMGGSKEELAYRIVNKLTEFEETGDTVAWEAAYQSWMDVKFARFPNCKRDE
ncbi:hypothetical protein B0H16DRAFT_1448431 [Mycena metata]|uniref:Uncharacterized protein n=1 Tax=Mycena metata TaxID=1033252 RepID=A0AAD7KC48_9AGAR|nr:hypothetical protein B0H16DRAFT_1448431 [Mycena metata]